MKCCHFSIFQVGLYIGEICRYIMAVPPKPEDSRHHIRCMMGNGMRATIWKDFIDRFKIKQMLEVYGSTEGNVSLSKLFCSGHYKYEIYQNNMFWCCSRMLSLHQSSAKLYLHSPICLHEMYWQNYALTSSFTFSHHYMTSDTDT
jgi:acyl-CoA synthetase (AMP-forming)/AMP-acid ligase II